MASNRTTDGSDKIQNFEHSKIRKNVLVLAANAFENPRIAVNQEVRAIKESLRRSWRRQEYSIKIVLEPTVNDLHRALLEYKPTIVHFCGHGNPGSILLVDDSGASRPLASEQLSEICSLFTSELECIILNTCYSSAQAEIVSRHVDYVIGIEGEIEDDTAIKFSEIFYDSLSSGQDIQISFELARVSTFNECRPKIRLNRGIINARQAARTAVSPPRTVPNKRTLFHLGASIIGLLILIAWLPWAELRRNLVTPFTPDISEQPTRVVRLNVTNSTFEQAVAAINESFQTSVGWTSGCKPLRQSLIVNGHVSASSAEHAIRFLYNGLTAPPQRLALINTNQGGKNEQFHQIECSPMPQANLHGHFFGTTAPRLRG